MGKLWNEKILNMWLIKLRIAILCACMHTFKNRARAGPRKFTRTVGPGRAAQREKAPSGQYSYFLYAVRGARIENFGQLISSTRGILGYTRVYYYAGYTRLG